MPNAVQTEHNLDFFEAPWNPAAILGLLDLPGLSAILAQEGWKLYEIGTVGGQWRETPAAYEILSFINAEPGNGHLIDVFEWFAYACRTSKKPLRILHTFNHDFARHLQERLGFRPDGFSDGEPDFIRHFHLEVPGSPIKH